MSDNIQKLINNSFPDFDYDIYIKYNDDLKKYTKYQAMFYFLKQGRNENRIYNKQCLYEMFDTYHKMSDIEKQQHIQRIDFLIVSATAEYNKITDIRYYYKLYDFCHDYQTSIDYVINDKKMDFRYFCYRYLNVMPDETQITNNISISDAITDFNHGKISNQEIAQKLFLLSDDWKKLMFKHVIKRVGIILRASYKFDWGGDIVNIYSFKRGLENYGYVVDIVTSPYSILDYDYIFLTNVTVKENMYHVISLNNFNKKYGFIALHEDNFKFPFMYNMFLRNIINKTNVNDMLSQPTYIRLQNDPKYFYDIYMKIQKRPNDVIYQHAELVITQSEAEKQYIIHDLSLSKEVYNPNLNVQIINLSSGLAEHWNNQPDDSFLKLTNLEQNNYILQVGRLEARKNHVASVIASRDIDMPLVFIASGCQNQYQDLVYYLIKNIRKYKTIILTPHIDSHIDGLLEFIKMPNGKKLEENVLQSAYHHARLNLHPAFMELPGYTILESIKCGTPCVASEWCSVSDYFEKYDGDKTLGGNVEYPLPYDLNGIYEAIHRILSKPINKNIYSNVFKRTSNDMGKELISYLHYLL